MDATIKYLLKVEYKVFEIVGRLDLVLRDKQAYVVGRVINEIDQIPVTTPVLRCHRSLDITTDNPTKFVNRCVSARIFSDWLFLLCLPCVQRRQVD